MNNKRIISIICAIILLCTFIMYACSDETTKPSNVTTSAKTDNITEEESGRNTIKDSLPDNLDYDGQIYRIYSNSSETLSDYIKGAEEQTGDVVFDTVIERNLSVEERLNIKFEYFIPSPAYDYNQIGTEVRNLVLSGDDTYDLIIAGQFGTCKLVTEGLFLNVLEGKYFDFEKPWWWVDYMKEISIGNDKSFFLVGDYFIDMLLGTRMLYYNRNLWENYYGNPDDLYNIVLDGKWTLEKMTELVRDFYSDLNGNGEKDENDLYGYVTYWTGSSVDAFAYAADLNYTSRDENGLITLTIYSERAVKFTEMLNEFFHSNGSYIYPIENAGNNAKFIAGESLFLGNATIDTTNSLRDMENDYGMLPNPKFDENQDKYRSLVHDTKNYGMIPITSNNLDMTSAVVEALCAESYRSVMPAYYETALKIKYARDQISAQMIDLIHDSIMTNFIFVYYASLNNIGSIFRTLVTNKNNDFTSEYNKLESGALVALDKLIDAYIENN